MQHIDSESSGTKGVVKMPLSSVLALKRNQKFLDSPFRETEAAGMGLASWSIT